MIGIDWIADEPVPIDADALAGEVDALVRPAAGVVGRAFERVAAREVGDAAPTTGSRSP